METKKHESEKVDAYLEKFEHPLKDVMIALRKLILSVDKEIGEEIKWNAPTFFYSGPMAASDPKLYKRYLVASNVHPKDHIMLVLPHGADVDDGSGFFEGEYKDGRRLLRFFSMQDVEDKETELKKAIMGLLKRMN